MLFKNTILFTLFLMISFLGYSHVCDTLVPRLHHNYFKQSRYNSIGGGYTSFLCRTSEDNTRYAPGFNVFAERKYFPRVSLGVSIQSVWLYNKYVHSNANNTGVSLYSIIDVFVNRGRYVKRSDWNFSAVLGMDISRYGLAEKKSYANARIGVITGAEVNYKLGKHTDIGLLYTYDICVYASHTKTNLNFGSLGFEFKYIIPQRTCGIRFR